MTEETGGKNSAIALLAAALFFKKKQGFIPCFFLAFFWIFLGFFLAFLRYPSLMLPRNVKMPLAIIASVPTHNTAAITVVISIFFTSIGRCGAEGAWPSQPFRALWHQKATP